MSRKKPTRSKAAHSGISFGQPIQHDWTTGDQIGHELRSLPITPEHLVRITDQQRVEIEDFPAAITQRISGIYTSLENDACKLILTAAVNDVMHLVERAYRLDGRSAAYSARSLFEHLVNFCDVSRSVVNTSERYKDHRYITQQHVANHRQALILLSSKERREEEKQLDRLATQVALRADEAVGNYGKAFKRQWADGSLYDRAKTHDLEEGYAGYRILSAVIHGSSGSLAGITKIIADTDVHRTGPDLELASLSWVEGLVSFLGLADELVAMTDSWEAREIQGRTANLIRFWPDVRRELRRIDKQLWPKSPPTGFMALVAFYPGGRKWYQYDTRTETLILAEPPEEEPDLSKLQEQYRRYQPEDFGGRPMTAICDGLSVQPMPNHQPVPASSIMAPAGHPAASTKPHIL